MKSPITPPRYTSAMLHQCQNQTDWARPRAATWTKPSRLRGLGDNSNQRAVIQGVTNTGNSQSVLGLTQVDGAREVRFARVGRC